MTTAGLGLSRRRPLRELHPDVCGRQRTQVHRSGVRALRACSWHDRRADGLRRRRGISVQPRHAGSEADGERLEAGFRPEHASVGEAGIDGGMCGAVASVEPLGASTIVIAACGSVTVKALAPGQSRHAIGELVALVPNPARMAFFHTATGERLSTASSINHKNHREEQCLTNSNSNPTPNSLPRLPDRLHRRRHDHGRVPSRRLQGGRLPGRGDRLAHARARREGRRALGHPEGPRHARGADRGPGGRDRRHRLSARPAAGADPPRAAAEAHQGDPRAEAAGADLAEAKAMRRRRPRPPARSSRSTRTCATTSRCACSSRSSTAASSARRSSPRSTCTRSRTGRPSCEDTTG